MTKTEELLDQLCAYEGADGVTSVPLLHRDGAHVLASLDGDRVVGVPLFVSRDESCVRAATMQEIKDARLDRPVTHRYEGTPDAA